MAGMNDAASVDSGRTAAFRAARDLLLAHRTDYATARAEFSWPELDEFNWALDWFDVIAAEHPQRTALRVVWDNGTDESVSYGEMATRSSQVADVAARPRRAARRPHPVDARQRGAAVGGHARRDQARRAWSSPRPPCCSPRTSPTGSSAAMCGTWSPSRPTRRSSRTSPVTGRGSSPARCRGWARYADSRDASPGFTPDGVTRASDPLLLYFTSGTTSQPKLVGHTHASYPVGHLSTMYWIGIQPGDVHLNISSPGWAKHAWSNFFAPWNARGHDLHPQPRPVQRRRAARRSATAASPPSARRRPSGGCSSRPTSPPPT